MLYLQAKSLANEISSYDVVLVSPLTWFFTSVSPLLPAPQSYAWLSVEHLYWVRPRLSVLSAKLIILPAIPAEFSMVGIRTTFFPEVQTRGLFCFVFFLSKNFKSFVCFIVR